MGALGAIQSLAGSLEGARAVEDVNSATAVAPRGFPKWPRAQELVRLRDSEGAHKMRSVKWSQPPSEEGN